MRKSILGILCFVGGLLTIPLLGYVYLRFGAPPVAVTDTAFPLEKQIVHVPLHARIAREMPGAAPIASNPQTLLAGAAIYQEHCAFCHGLPGSPAAIGKHMYPAAPGLWVSHRPGVVGVSDDPVGESYWKVKNGIRLAGMPAYADLLSEQQMWEVSLLVKSADHPLSPELAAALTPAPQAGAR